MRFVGDRRLFRLLKPGETSLRPRRASFTIFSTCCARLGSPKRSGRDLQNAGADRIAVKFRMNQRSDYIVTIGPVTAGFEGPNAPGLTTLRTWSAPLGYVYQTWILYAISNILALHLTVSTIDIYKMNIQPTHHPMTLKYINST